MWESITNIINGTNGIIVIALVAVLIFALVRMSKSGSFSLHTSFLSLGSADKEREVIRHQIEAAHASSFELPELLSLDVEDYKVKYLVERIYDKVVEWVIFNHITASPIYINSKSAAVYNLVLTLHPTEEVRSADAKKVVNDWCVKIIDELVHVRKYYTEAKK